MGWVLLALLVGLLIGYSNGWHSAHKTIEKECERLGAFYVGDKVFRCQLEQKGNE